MASHHQSFELVEPLDHSEISEDIATNHPGNVPHSNPLLSGPGKPPSIHEPKRLRRTQCLYFSLFGQILLTIFPLLFLSLTAVAISLDNKSASGTGSTIQQVIALSPTVFPIIFAAIVGRFFRSLGLYWAERGVKLGTLERLIGSQTLFSAIERQVLLRGQYLLGISIIIIWALSPLGGQSALRLLAVSPEILSTNTTIRYLPIDQALNTVMSPDFGASNPVRSWPKWAPIFMTAVTTSYQYQNSSQDMFGNVRIPSLDSLPSTTNDSWTVINHSESIPYSSLLGIPVGGLPANGTTSFNLTSRYFGIQCKSSKHTSSIAIYDNLFRNSSSGEPTGSWAYKSGASFVVQLGFPIAVLTKGGRFNFSEIYNETTIPFNMTSMNGHDSTPDLSLIDCSMEPQDVESSVQCEDRLCKVTAMKRLPLGFDSWRIASILAIQRSFTYFPLSVLTAPSSMYGARASSSILEMWIEYPYTILGSPGFANLSVVSLPMLSRSIETLFNTYWQSTYGYKYLHGNLHADVTDSFYDNITEGRLDQPVDFSTSQALATRVIGEKYQCNMTFATILIVISGLLVFASLATIALMHATRAPDILGYMSSFTRDNPYAAFKQASHMDGLETARELREMRITVGDVNPREEIGHIAFAATVEVQRLKENRLYD
ncbi:unnamed protein product [Clonostachys byssicola]|uniref:Uncharacterized protein n=1 Tax=Clonostachys byssicola TaxID=160290 RepID=A0A9N9Y432_9HYPO|nr:unnamed protein product [Clonostachys byssicola]